MASPPAETAAELLDVVPLIMRSIRAEMRAHRAVDLSVPQFRALAYLNHREGASLSDVADHLGLTLPSMSKLIDGLVERKLVTREFDSVDRRRVTLALTARGHAILQTSHASTQAHLAEVLATLSSAERATIVQAMRALRPLFASEREKELTLARENHGNS